MFSLIFVAVSSADIHLRKRLGPSEQSCDVIKTWGAQWHQQERKCTVTLSLTAPICVTSPSGCFFKVYNYYYLNYTKVCPHCLVSSDMKQLVSMRDLPKSTIMSRKYCLSEVMLIFLNVFVECMYCWWSRCRLVIKMLTFSVLSLGSYGI